MYTFVSYLEKNSITTATKKLHIPFLQFFSFDFGLALLILRRDLTLCVIFLRRFFPLASFLVTKRRKLVARMPTFFQYDLYTVLKWNIHQKFNENIINTFLLVEFYFRDSFLRSKSGFYRQKIFSISSCM